MSHLSWTRAAYILFAFAVLTALLKLHGGASADPRPLASRSAQNTNTTTTGEANVAAGATVQSVQGGNVRRSVSVVVQDGRDGRKESTVIRGNTAGHTSAKVSRAAEQQKRQARAMASISGTGGNSGKSLPVFRRPSFRAPTGGGADAPVVFPNSGPVCGNLGNFPKSSKAIFPLPKGYLNSYDDTWGAPRVQGAHEGTDLMSPTGTPEYAITDGTLVPVSGSNADGWNTLGGYAVMLRADYSIGPIHAGDLFYYAHMDGKSPLPIGSRVRAGQVLGIVGDTGQGPEVTRGLFPSHLHLGWYDMSGARTNLPSGAMNPYPLLQWLKTNGGAVVGGSRTSYCVAPQKQTPTPATGESYWPSSGSPGRQPDLDTGSRKAAPSPVAEKVSSSYASPSKQHKTQTATQSPAPEQIGSPEQGGSKTPGAKPKRPRDANRPAPQKPGVDQAKPVAGPEDPTPNVSPATGNQPGAESNNTPSTNLTGIGVNKPNFVDEAGFRRWLKALIRQATAQAHHGPKAMNDKKVRENSSAKPKHRDPKKSVKGKQENHDTCAASKRAATCKKKEISGATVPAVEKTATEPVPVSGPAKDGTTDSVAPAPPQAPSKTTNTPESTSGTTGPTPGTTQSPEQPTPVAGGTTASPAPQGGTTSK